MFAESAVPSDRPIDESILIRSGHYCGRRFQCDGLHIVWFVEENQLKLYGRDGALVHVRIALPEPELPQARAA